MRLRSTLRLLRSRSSVSARAALAAALLGLAWAAAPADAAPLRASILFKGKQASETWYVVSADDRGVQLSASETGAGARLVPNERIDSIAFNEPDGWREAMSAFDDGRYDISVRRFGSLAKDYEAIATIEDSYGARARYYLIESHRLSGNHEAVASEAALLKIKPVKLSAAYRDQLNLYEAWGQADKEAWLSLDQSLQQFEKPDAEGGEAIGKPFRELPASQFVQAAYLRGVLKKNTEKEAAAINDFYRAFVLSFGAEGELAQRSIIEALNLLKAKPDHETDPRIRREGHSLVKLLKDTYGQDVPAELAIFTEPPPKVEGEEEGVATAPEAGAAATANGEQAEEVMEEEEAPDLDAPEESPEDDGAADEN